MSTRSVLIIGGSGFLGTHLALRLRAGYKVFATYNTHPMTMPGVTFLPMNLIITNQVKRVMQAAKPDFIIYAPGPKGGDAGINLEQIYSKGAATAMAYAEAYGPKFIFVSSCFTFDGERGNYHETDAALPQILPGRAKMNGENFIRSKSLHSIIFRCSPLFGRGNGYNFSFLDQIRMSLDRGKQIELTTNSIHSFAPVEGFVECVAEWIAKPVVRNRVLHYGGLTKTSYADFGISFANRFGFDPNLIVPMAQARDDKKNAMRGSEKKKDVLDYSLNSSQIIELLKVKAFLLEESFNLIEQKLVARS